MKSSQITVRNVDPVLKQRIEKLAKLKSMSINDFVLDTLRVKVDLKPDKKYVVWDKYQGIVSEGGINQAVLDDFEAIDAKMWD
jgi:hypothetical protein